LYSAITSLGWGTVLHIAAGSNHVHFVDELVKLLDHDALELQDYLGNTAFCFAAAVGNVQIAEIMLKKNASLPSIRGGEGVTPLYLATLQGKSDMAWYLFPKSREILEENDWNMVFITCINTGLYGKCISLLLFFVYRRSDKYRLHLTHTDNCKFPSSNQGENVQLNNNIGVVS
jgi:hypothetical protein